jgi:hypothetical protein
VVALDDVDVQVRLAAVALVAVDVVVLVARLGVVGRVVHAGDVEPERLAGLVREHDGGVRVSVFEQFDQLADDHGVFLSTVRRSR